MPSLHHDLTVAVYEQIQRLDLPELPSDRVVCRQVISDRDVVLPAVLVTPMGIETMDPGTFEDTDVGYPVTVWFLSASNQDLTLKERELGWRQQVVDAFLDKPLPVPSLEPAGCVWDVQVEPGPVVDLTLWRDHNLLGGFVTLRVQTRKTRGRLPDNVTSSVKWTVAKDENS